MPNLEFFAWVFIEKICPIIGHSVKRIRPIYCFSQGNLDWHGNPSWFLGLLDESDFQTKISQKWLEILISFFQIWFSGLHLALVTCCYPNLSKNGSRLKKKCQKIWVLFLGKTGQFSAFLTFWKMLEFERLQYPNYLTHR